MPIDIKVLSTTAMKTVFEELAPAFERATGNRLAVTLGPSLRLEKQLGEGEAADMAIVSASGARDLVASGKMVAGSIVDIATSSIGVAVQKGAPKPDISSSKVSSAPCWRRNRSPARNRSAAARAAFTSPRFSKKTCGIAEVMQAKAKYGAGGAAGLDGLVVLRGEADIGIQQMAELMAVDGIDVVGPLPAEIQMVTPFVAGIPTSASHAKAGRAMIDFLITPEAKRVLKAKGLEPAYNFRLS